MLGVGDHDSNGNDTATTQVDDKDGYYKQDKDDDKYEDVSMDILLYSILIQFFSQKQSLLLLSPIRNQIIITRMTQEEKRQPQYKEVSEWR
mmetsp:Transcript_12738/g.13957  ORF Transcript_12738/g.13957 Transcript_12738/m.13957 type:complete len:91 (+) Transcript_12738:9-281(+)